MRKINALALAAGVTTLVLIAASYFIPWWQLTVGNPVLATVNFSPLNLNFALFNNIITIPLIWALNISCLLTLLAGGLILIIYSVVPTKPYASRLLGYGYKQPLIAVILFVIEVVGLTLSVKAFTGFNFPLIGAGTVGLPAGLAPAGISISVDISAAFLWPFYLAIVVTVLCIAARFYHRKIAKAISTQFPPTSPPSGESPIS
jgi:hypothetical protein